MKRFFALISGALSVLIVSSATATAAELYWDPGMTGNATAGGAGNWDTNDSFWFNGTADIAWTNANNDDANFTGTAGVVTLTNGISAGDIYFTNVTGNYYITNLTGTEILSVANTIDTGGGDHTIAALLANTSTLNKNGDGRLHLPVDNSSTFSGSLMINQGEVSIENNNSLGVGSATVAPGAALEFNSGTNNLSGVYNNITASGTGITNRGAIRNVSGANTIYGNLVLAGDTLLYSDSGRLTFGGGGYTVSAGGNNYNLTGAGPGGVWIGSDSLNIGTGSVTIEGPSTLYMYVSSSYLSYFANVVVKTGATYAVDNTNGFGTAPATLMTTNIVLDGGTLANTGGYTVNSTRGITITTNGGTITSSGGAWTTCNIYSPSNVPVTFGGSGNIRPGGSGGSSGNIVNLGTGTLIKIGSDDVNTTYATSFVFSNMVLNGGSLTFNYDQTSGQPSTLGSVPSAFCSSNIWLNGGALHAGHSTTINSVRGIYVASGGGTVADTVSSGGTVTMGSVISGPGSMNFPNGVSGKTTAIVLAANNTYAGTTTVGASSSVTVGSGSTSGTLGTGNTADSGILTFNRTGSYTYGGNISGSGTVVKNAGGTVTLTGVCTYTNTTTVGAGALLMDNTNASAITVNSSGVLGGTGVFGGDITVNAGGTLALGIGTLSASNNVSIAGNISVSVNNSASPSSGTAIVTGTLANTGAGTVSVSNLGAALAAGNTFQLFSQPVSGGNNLTISGGGVQWANNLAADGSISVVGPLPQPVVNSVSLSGTNLVISGTNGYTGGGYYVLATTNIALPLSSWKPVFTNTFASGGLFSVTNPIVPGTPAKFYALKLE